MSTLSPTSSPLPAHDTRPRTVSALSYNSNRSRRSNSSSNKLDLIESPKDKKRLNTKADPSKALSEAQPAAVALEESNLDNIREMRHVDNTGNIITDPDRSNPTRYRFERPLDTIRSFQAAAEGTSHRRSSYYGRPASQVTDNSQNRRSGYWSSSGSTFSPPPLRQRASGGGYYRNSSYGFPAQSTVEEVPGSSQQYSRPMRQSSNPYYNQLGDSPMSQHSHQPSYDAMTSGSDENNKSTNPSSQNSSFDQLQQIRKPDENGYDQGYGQEQNYSTGSPQRSYPPYGMPHSQANVQPYAHPYSQQPYGQQAYGAPAPPPKDMGLNNPRVPIMLNGSNSGPPPTMSELKATPAKRQSWIKRRFSRRES